MSILTEILKKGLKEGLKKVWAEGLDPETKTKIQEWSLSGAVLAFVVAGSAMHDTEIIKYQREQNKIRAGLILILQVIVLAIVIVISWWLGLTTTMWLTGSVVYLLLCLALAWYIWHAAVTDKFNVRRKGFFYSPVWFWHCSWIVTISLNGLCLIWFLVRADQFGLYVLPFASVLFLIGISIWRASKNSIQVEYTPWFSWGVGTTVVALLVGWCVGTFVSRYTRSPQPTVRAEVDRKRELERRVSWSKHPGWTKAQDNRPMEIALLLSGGGYRAAVIHAGVLDALDRHCVPIRYLSTVSGGSIIGAYYALGIRPSQFKDRLMAEAPGLPDDLVDISSTFQHLFFPMWSTADTYAKHFKNVFFGSTTLNDTGDNPKLLINVTDIEAETKSAREILFKTDNSELNATTLGDAVAASGAFPGAFQAKALPWLPATGQGGITRRRFVDGGVVENLGLTGLDRYVKTLAPQETEPDIVIISDASKRGRAEKISGKAGVVKLITRSLDISYDFAFSLIDQTIGLEKYVLIRSSDEALFPTGPKFDFTSKITGKQETGTKVVSEVARYDTLKELLPKEVEKAYWVGQMLGEHFWDAINQRRMASANDKENSCPA
jgi:predicted acylesterase/phospholipase RssA